MDSIIQDAKRRIETVRKTDVDFIVRKNGVPVKDAHIDVKMKNHDFLFGAVCYEYGTYEDPAMNKKFDELFPALFNYTMVPYHWSWYEPEKGKYNEPYTTNLINWADSHNLKKKLHALIWHELCPDWVTYDDDVTQLYAERIGYLLQNFGDRFDFFDVANETTVNDRFDNPVSRWVKEYGPVEMVKFGVEQVRQYKPDAKLLYGDWNVHGDDYYNFLAQLKENDVGIDILGLQSHQHRDIWTFEETMRVMDKASAFGWPLHFPECSICSGKPDGDINFAAGAINKWTECEEDLYWQADFAKDFYTLVFSHPATEALSWFDFTEHRWLCAPSGVVDDNLDPKPVYHTLMDLIHKQWHSDASLVTASEGVASTRLFFGDYEITVTASGKTKTRTVHLPRKSFYKGENAPAVVYLDID